ncbi:MAG: DUF2798 domain-containing protein [Pseudomonadota bacterium]
MIPARYAHIAFGFTLSCIMSFLISGVATLRAVGLVEGFFGLWIAAWLPSWALAFPIVLFVAPLARRIVGLFVVPDEGA